MVNYFEGEFRISTLVWKLLPWCLWGIPSQGIFSRMQFCTRHIPGNFRSWLKVLVVLLTTRKLVQGKQLRNTCFGRCGNLLDKGEDVILCRCRILLLQVCCQYLYFTHLIIPQSILIKPQASLNSSVMLRPVKKFLMKFQYFLRLGTLSTEINISKNSLIFLK